MKVKEQRNMEVKQAVIKNWQKIIFLLLCIILL